jgi:hypothetical protein
LLPDFSAATADRVMIERPAMPFTLRFSKPTAEEGKGLLFPLGQLSVKIGDHHGIIGAIRR